MIAPAIYECLPSLRERLPLAAIGVWPTPVHQLPPALGADLWVKREDLSDPLYGGNKVRTLQAVLGDAMVRGATTIWATGAFGSNHALATALHAPTLGLRVGALLFPQPPSAPAVANALALAATDARLIALPSVAALPAAMVITQLRDRSAVMMEPGAATPIGACGALSAALELALQVQRGELPLPTSIVVPIGSICTTSGLLAGCQLATRLGLWTRTPTIVGVRVTPWPVTSAWRVHRLARRALSRIETLAGREFHVEARALHAGLIIDGAQLGAGYGLPTRTGRAAIAAFAQHAGVPALDEVYAGKAAAALATAPLGPTLFWSTKSAAPLPVANEVQRARMPRAMRAWIAGR